MIRLLHGDNLVESRKGLGTLISEARGKGAEVVFFSGKKITISDLRGALESGSLLGNNRLVVIENLLGGIQSKEKSKVIGYLKDGDFDNDLVLWEEKEIKKTGLPKVFQEQVFKVNQIIFRFLESLKPGNQKEMLNLLLQLKQREEAEMVFYMLIRQFRYLILGKDNELSKMPEWQSRKFVSQSKFFSEEKLKEVYKSFLKIDFQQKTSSDSFSLYSRLDLFIADL